jgi:hypothetical protein
MEKEIYVKGMYIEATKYYARCISNNLYDEWINILPEKSKYFFKNKKFINYKSWWNINDIIINPLKHLRALEENKTIKSYIYEAAGNCFADYFFKCFGKYFIEENNPSYFIMNWPIIFNSHFRAFDDNKKQISKIEDKSLFEYDIKYNRNIQKNKFQQAKNNLNEKYKTRICWNIYNFCDEDGILFQLLKGWIKYGLYKSGAMEIEYHHEIKDNNIHEISIKWVNP